MATIYANAVNLASAQTGNGQTTNIADRGPRNQKAGVIKITTTVGATPTCTYLIEGSADGTNWTAAAYADSATPETVSVATFAITTATTVYKIIRTDHPWRYFRITFSANTNVTNTVDAYFVA